jgi:hypothetical protein
VPGQIAIVICDVIVCCVFGILVNRINQNLAFKYLGF